MQAQPGQKEQDIEGLLKIHRQALETVLWQQTEVEKRLEQMRQRQQALDIELGHLWRRKEYFKLFLQELHQIRERPGQRAYRGSSETQE
jgi:hypothetical protein